MYENILVYSTGSEGASKAIEQACELARTYDATIHALFVIDQTYPAASEFDIAVEKQERDGEKAIEQIREKAREAGVDITEHLRRGVPHKEILACAYDHDLDLIVMGTHGRTGFNRFVHAGSIAERVVRLAEVPVLTVQMAS